MSTLYNRFNLNFKAIYLMFSLNNQKQSNAKCKVTYKYSNGLGPGFILHEGDK